MDKQDRQDLRAVRQVMRSVFKTAPKQVDSLSEILKRMRRNDRDSGFMYSWVARVDFTNRPRFIAIGVEADEAINHED